MIASVDQNRLTLAGNDLERIGIVGGGISGLSSALLVIESGVDPKNIHIFESGDRVGGKIQTRMMGERAINAGTEFIDSEDAALLSVVDKLKGEPYNVKLIRSDEQDTEAFQRLNGTLMSGKEFCAAYAPIAKRIMADRKRTEEDPNYTITLDNGKVAKLDDLSADEYLNYLQRTTPVNENRTTAQWLYDNVTFQTNRVSPEIVEMAKSAYCRGECGQSPEKISARLFVGETSPSPDRFLYSDCGFRVEGGMERVPQALEQYLRDKGVNFHMNTPVAGISREGGINTLQFGGDTPEFKCGKTICALPAYAMDKIQGLKELGLSEESAQVLQNTQYCDTAKFSIRVNDGFKLPEANFYSPKNGYECWSPEPGVVTFLVHADQINKFGTARELMQHCLDDYAKTNGFKAADAFAPISPKNAVFNYPGKKASCYGASAPGEMAKLQKFGESLDALAANGVGLVGTFMPFDGTVGFMNCGVESAKRSVGLLCGKGRALEQAVDHGLPQRMQAQRMHTSPSTPSMAI